MRLLIREYLGSLRERDELDAILPDLLTEMGFTVFSRPSRGPRQHGVDVGAVGIDDDGVRKVFLFSVKAGNLTRSDWNVGQQALKPSLDEILDVYLRSRLPVALAHLPVVICLTFGGGVHESVRSDVEGYIARNRTSKIDFRQWDGDYLAKLIDEGPLGDSLLAGDPRAHLRKAAATVEEPDIAFGHFARLVTMLGAPTDQPADRDRHIRQMILSLWIMFAWGREAGNVEAPYRASELALLTAWDLLKGELGRNGVRGERAGLLINSLVELHFAIWDEQYGRQILPHADNLHAISMAVGSSSSLDVNLKLFETAGRIALRGLWMVWQLENGDPSAPQPVPDGARTEAIDRLAFQLVALIRNNPVLLSPIADHQTIDIALVITFLATRPGLRQPTGDWIDQLLAHAIVAFRSHGRYPTKYSNYWKLAAHPEKRNDDYRREATDATILYPTLALWADALGRDDLVDAVATFKANELQGSTFQLYYLDHDSEQHLYRGSDQHGAAVTRIPIARGEKGTLAFVRRECGVLTAYDHLSAVRLGHWPIVLMACHFHRLPLPPQIWRFLFDDPVTSTEPPPDDDEELCHYLIPALSPRALLKVGSSDVAIAGATVSRSQVLQVEA